MCSWPNKGHFQNPEISVYNVTLNAISCHICYPCRFQYHKNHSLQALRKINNSVEITNYKVCSCGWKRIFFFFHPSCTWIFYVLTSMFICPSLTEKKLRHNMVSSCDGVSASIAWVLVKGSLCYDDDIHRPWERAELCWKASEQTLPDSPFVDVKIGQL